MRVIISTQGMRLFKTSFHRTFYGSHSNLDSLEPTVVPNTLIDLCSVTIMHRFSSPAWWEHLSKHVSADMSSGEAFDRVVRLKVTHFRLAEMV